MYENIVQNDHVLHKELQCLSMKDFPSISTTSSINVCSSDQYDSHFFFINYKQKQQIIESNWGRYALDLNLWEDNKSSIVQMKESKILFDNKECCGFLSDRLIGIGSSYLTKVPENGAYILSKYIMRKKNLTDISILQYHRYLQYIDIANNNITCLSPLNNLSYLMYLDVSRNKITCLSNFSPPWYLTYVNLSYNSIISMSDLKNCWSIMELNLSHNLIEYISGLENLKYLQNLDLSYNFIDCIENLDNLNLLQKLNLEGNCITSFKSSIPDHGINILSNLQTINLAYNKLSILSFFKDACNLRFVNLKFNKITDLSELMNFSSLMYEIDLRGNVCTKWTNYRNVLISFIPSIKLIDGIEVSATEKITSTILFTSPLDLKAARNVIKSTLLEQLNISKVDAHVQAYDENGPLLIILTGPSTVKKLALALDVIRTRNNKVKYCRWHTTKEAYENDERNGYIPVNREVFNDMARHGEFLVVLDLLGHNYGFHSHQITQLRYENKIGLTQMNLYASIEISKRYSNVKRILVLTNNVDIHRTWIKEKFEMYTWIKDSIENLLVVKTAKERANNKETEAANYIFNFIEEILDEVIECLELPSPYSSYVRLQSTQAKATDIILENKIMLPNRRNNMVSKSNKYIRFDEKKNANHTINSFNRLPYEENRRTEGLKVILDEKSNIIIHDEKFKHEIHKTKMFHRRNILKTDALNDFNYDNLSDSTSSDEMIDTKTRATGQSEILKNVYVDLIIKSRDLYLSYHKDHPGFFTLTLLTDDYTSAFNLLIDFMHESDINQSYKKPICLPEINHFIKTEIPIALTNIVNEIRDNLSILKLFEKK